MAATESFISKVHAARGEPVERVYLVFVASRNAKKQARYFFIKLFSGNEPAFRDLLKAEGAFDLAEYGTILASGYGEPSAELKADMARRYRITYADTE